MIRVHLLPIAALAPALLGQASCDEGIPANSDRPLRHVSLDSVDVTGLTAAATYTFGASEDPGGSLSIGDLQILGAWDEAGAPLEWQTEGGDTLHLDLPTSAADVQVTIAWTFRIHNQWDGLMRRTHPTLGYESVSLLCWPDLCGNFLPWRPHPREAITYSVGEVTGAPAGHAPLAPASVDALIPMYALSLATGQYECTQLGHTPAGTGAEVCWLPGGEDDALTGSASLLDAMAWTEDRFGPYVYGSAYATEAAYWGLGDIGGMETHPRVMVSTGSMDDWLTIVHEWFHTLWGDGVRLACNEDFGPIDEGLVETMVYLFAEDTLGPVAMRDLYDYYREQLEWAAENEPDVVLWPGTCNASSLEEVFTWAAYYRPFFAYDEYRALPGVGTDGLMAGLTLYWSRHALGAATMDDLIAALREATGVDPTPTFVKWLASPAGELPASYEPLRQGLSAEARAAFGPGVRHPGARGGRWPAGE